MIKQRNVTFDLMKGVTILLMMISHLVCRDTGPANHFIYSFHMPLFFILAGMFAKDLEAIPSFLQFTKKNAKRLLLPFVVTMLLRCMWGGLQTIIKHDIAYLLQPTLSLLVASPDGWETQWGLVYTGPMWFLIALFWVRELFYGMQYVFRNLPALHRDITMLVISVALSVASVLLYPYAHPFPFCFMQTFTAIPLYVLGWFIHKHPLPKWSYWLCVLAWPFSVKYGTISMAYCNLEYYPLSFIGACGGTYIVYLLCQGIDKWLSNVKVINLIPRGLIWCGIYSLPILCMHELELYSGFIWSLVCKFPTAHYLVGWGEVGIGVLMALLILHIPYLKNIYK